MPRTVPNAFIYISSFNLISWWDTTCDFKEGESEAQKVYGTFYRLHNKSGIGFQNPCVISKSHHWKYPDSKLGQKITRISINKRWLSSLLKYHTEGSREVNKTSAYIALL